MTQQAGFTLVELLVVIAVAATLTVLTVPAFNNLLLEAEMASQVNRFVHGMHVARQEAEKRGADIALCRSANGQRCAYDQPWQAGFIVFVNRDQDDPPQVDAGETLLQVGPPFPGGRIGANRQAFVFRPYGQRSVNGTLTLCDRRGRRGARTVIVSYTGRPRAASVTAGNKAITCPS